jgi:primary-amine oxidase
MSTETIIPSATPQGASTIHPLSALSGEEINLVAALIKGIYPTAAEIHFKVLTLHEPPKEQVLSYLDAEHAIDDGPFKHRVPDRKAWVNYYIKNTVQCIPCKICN